MLPNDICSKARLAKDPRFDGKFFTAVKTTGIYCRSICPVNPPKEENVSYYCSAIECAIAGFRPCLRCRPDSAPGSPAWKGVNTTLDRALKLINEGALQHGTLTQLAERLGITDRYLRQLFTKTIGASPKSYALYQQCLFAKTLLHQTKLPIHQVAIACGFNSVRRFNDCFKTQLQLTPSQMRKAQTEEQPTNKLTLTLHYRPPYDWHFIQQNLAARCVDNLEWCDKNSYGRTITWLDSQGEFTATHNENNHCFHIEISLNKLEHLRGIINNIRRILDLDVDLQVVEQHLKPCLPQSFDFNSGIRLPGIWHVFEAGIRAILGQQISVAAARTLVSQVVHHLGQTHFQYKLFPTPQAVAQSDLDFMKIPGSRKQTLRNLAMHFVENSHANNPDTWLPLKGIGPWTVNYATMRGLSNSDIFLGGDLGVKKALAHSQEEFDPSLAAPWQSYLTYQLWSQL